MEPANHRYGHRRSLQRKIANELNSPQILYSQNNIFQVEKSCEEKTSSNNDYMPLTRTGCIPQLTQEIFSEQLPTSSMFSTKKTMEINESLPNNTQSNDVQCNSDHLPIFSVREDNNLFKGRLSKWAVECNVPKTTVN